MTFWLLTVGVDGDNGTKSRIIAICNWCREYWYIGRRLEGSFTTITIGSNITINDFEGICGGGELRVEVDA